jgi:4-diphosphocytidyl-2-C-methyl-D-erythritol kinase
MTRRMAPAKLTVSLRVTGVRPDGFHELQAEMVTLDLADELELVEGGSGVTVAAAPGTRADALPRPEENLVSRALVAAGRAASVHVTKRIPLGGGLGGGSADAAAVLRWAGCTDAMVALGIGADVPFCVVGGRARVEGVGELVTPLPFEHREYLLLVPPFGVDTRQVYRAWDERPSTEGPNHLARAALAVEPRLATWRDALGEAAGVEPRLAGSGSTWFVEGATAPVAEVRVAGARVPLVRARTVPSRWEGD